MSHTSRLSVGLAIALLACVGCGTNQQAVREAQREEDRRIMQVEDLTNQRNALQAEVRRVKESATAMQTELKTAQQQLEQARTELARAQAELGNARTLAAAAEAQKVELARLKEQLTELSTRVNAAPVAKEERVVTPAAPPTTQPDGSTQNK